MRPEDWRCRRLIASGCVPDRAGQPTQIQLHITLEDLLRRTGGPAQPGQGRGAGPELEQRLRPRLLGPGAGPVPDPTGPGRPGDLTAGGAARVILDAGTVRDLIIASAAALFTGRAVIARDPHCAAPGCTEPPTGCQVHHITPRSRSGRTKLSSLILACSFHDLILIHQWGWTITLNPTAPPP